MIVTSIIISSLVIITATFFFVFTRGALLAREWRGGQPQSISHIYPVYSENWLIKLIDFQPLISAILLFQYDKIVDSVVSEIRKSPLVNKKVLITSCAFGNAIPRIVSTSIEKGAQRVYVTDILENELRHAAGKLTKFSSKVSFIKEDATSMKQSTCSMDINIMFFLLHELTHEVKNLAINEAGRVVKPGGRLVIAEFHRPNSIILRAFSGAYFTVFEPYAQSIWEKYDPVRMLSEKGGWSCEKTTFFFGNFQVVVATKVAPQSVHELV